MLFQIRYAAQIIQTICLMLHYTVITYLVYIALMVLIVGWTGWRLHQAGKPFVRMVLYDDILKADLINHLLLLGYYLVNIGYSFFMLDKLPEVNNPGQVIEALSTQIGGLVLLLATLHYGNMLVFTLWRACNKRILNTKN